MISLDKISKRYKDNVILEDVDFSLPFKSLVCVMGPSGVGKSTLLNI